ncbi:uncharacterized protein LOC144747076 [Ciona intestinalis]
MCKLLIRKYSKSSETFRTVFVLQALLLMTSAVRHQVETTTQPEPFHVMLSMMSRTVVRVNGRDPTRHMTTFNVIDGDVTSQLVFGFPPSSMRPHVLGKFVFFFLVYFLSNFWFKQVYYPRTHTPTVVTALTCVPGNAGGMRANSTVPRQRYFILFYSERMELIEFSRTQNGTVRKVALRHPWHDVWITSDQRRRIRTCSFQNNANTRCTGLPYLYLEKWNSTGECSNSAIQRPGTEFAGKMRFNYYSREGALVGLVYVYATESSWQLQGRTQISLINHALAVASKRAWEESVNFLFEQQINRFRTRKKRKIKQGRRRRRRRCTINPVEIRDRLIAKVSTDSMKAKVRRELKTNRACSPHSNESRVAVAARVPWVTMAFEDKKSLLCCVGHVVRLELREALMGLADTRCVRRKKWGKLSESERAIFLDRYLTVAWVRRSAEADQWLSSIISETLDSRTTTLCFSNE